MKRSVRRARLGWRSVLVLILLSLLLWLIGRILGHRIGGESPSLADSDRRSLEQNLGGGRRLPSRKARAEGGTEPLEFARWKPETEVAETGAEKEEVGALVEGGFLSGPSWLRFRLPPGFDLERTRIAVEAVHAGLPGLRSRRVLRATSRREPDEIVLLLEAVPGGVWLELSHESSCSLFGPWITAPFNLDDLGQLAQSAEVIPLPADRGSLHVAPSPRNPPGAAAAWVTEGWPDDRAGPITRPADRLDDSLLLRGPYEFVERRTAAQVDPARSNGVRPTVAGALLGIQEHDGGLLYWRLMTGEDDRIPLALAADPIYAVPGGGRCRWDASVELPSGYSLVSRAHGRLSIERKLLDRFRPLLMDEQREETETAILLEDLLLFDPETLDLDPEDEDRVLMPLLHGHYRLVDLARSSANRIVEIDDFEIEKDQVLRFELSHTPPPERRLRIQVVAAATDAPLAGAAVFVGASRFEPPPWLPGAAMSDAEGMIEARGLPDRELVVLARAPGYEAASWRGRAREGEAEVIRLALHRAPGLEVRCRDQGGAPVRPEKVAAVGRDGALALAEVDEEGRAHFPGLSPGRYAIMPVIGGGLENLDGWDWLEQQLGALVIDHPRADDRPLVLTMPRPRRVRLDLRLSAAAPARFDLIIQPQEEPLAPGLWLRIQISGVGPGPLAIDGLPAGRYRATANLGLAGAIADFEVADRDDAVVPLVLDFD